MLILKQSPTEQFVVTVPPSDSATVLRLRSFMRHRRNGGTVLSVAFETVSGVVYTREPLSGALSDGREARRASPTTGIDTDIHGGEG